MIGFLKLLARAPEWFLYGISDFLYFLVFRVVGYRKTVVIDNLTKCFPDKSQAEISQLVKDFYHNFCDIIVENVMSIHMTQERILNKVVFDHTGEELKAILNSGQPIILMASHQANWEWLLVAANAYFDHPVDVIYQPLDNKKIDKLIFDIRSKFGGYPVPKGKVMRDLVKRKNVVRLFTIAGDQTPHISERKHWTTFFGRETAFFTGAQFIGEMTQYPCFLITIHRQKRGQYTGSFVKLVEPPYEKKDKDNPLVEIYVKALESTLRKSPADWLWSHKRWKYTPQKAMEFEESRKTQPSESKAE